MTWLSHVRNERGVILAISLFFLVMLTLLGLAALFSSTTELDLTGNERVVNTAVDAANGGAERYLASLQTGLGQYRERGGTFAAANGYPAAVPDSTNDLDGDGGIDFDALFISKTVTSATKFVKNNLAVGAIGDVDLAAEPLAGDPNTAWVTATATSGQVTKAVRVQIRYALDTSFWGALISDANSTCSPGTNPKGAAQCGNIVFNGNGTSDSNLYLDGGASANGNILYYSNNGASGVDMTDASTCPDGSPDCAVELHVSDTGTLSQDLGGTSGAIPDYTDPSSSAQLFDFTQFIHAANQPGVGEVMSLAQFADYFQPAPGADCSSITTPLEGIIVVNVDATLYGNNNPKLDTAQTPADSNPATGDFRGVCPIDVRGTLLFNITNNANPLYKIFVKTGLNVNPADLSTVIPGDPSTYTTGYPPPCGGAGEPVCPWDVDLSGYADCGGGTVQCQNFGENADLPALMYNTGIIDIHDEANISGVLYTPSFVEIEQKADGNTQYINGSIIAGGGIYIEDRNTANAGNTIISFDADALTDLAVRDVARVLSREAWKECMDPNPCN
ncbi:MAG: pilus assembly PilX N-terminal domain-containing protein [Nitrospirota bacterium]